MYINIINNIENSFYSLIFYIITLLCSILYYAAYRTIFCSIFRFIISCNKNNCKCSERTIYTLKREKDDK